MPAETEHINHSRRFVFGLNEYQSPSSKLRGYQELVQFHLRAPSPMYILGQEAFTQYQEHGLTADLRAEIEWAYDAIRQANPTRGDYVGRAVFVPEIDNPKGPRSAGIFDKEQYVVQVLSTWKYAVDHEYVRDGSDIALILHPFINVMEPRPAYGHIQLEEGETLPWAGGNIVLSPEPGRPHQICIVATFGTDEAVQSCPSDQYWVDLDEIRITRRNITLKDTTFVPLEGDEYIPALIPKRFQLKPALTDAEILMVAEEARKVLTQKPNSRLEFIVQPDGVYIREIAPWNPPSETDLLKLRPDEEVVLNVVRVESAADIAKIVGSDVAVYFGPKAFQLRSADLFHQVAGLAQVNRLYGLLYGSIITSHPARALLDSGHSIVHMGDRELQDGDRIKIGKEPNGNPNVELLDAYAHAAVRLTDFRRLYNNEAGPKAASLSRMIYEGMAVPDGFVLTTESMWKFLTDIGLLDDIHRLDTVNLNSKALDRLTKKIIRRIKTAGIPQALQTQITDALAHYHFPSWAVRSSGNEDGETSLAGLYDSTVNVPGKNVTYAIRTTLMSYFAAGSIRKLRNINQIPSKMHLGVILHEYVTGENAIGAVVFTNPDFILIQAAKKSPQGLVAHTEQNYISMKHFRNPTDGAEITSIGNPSMELPQHQIDQIIGQVIKIESLFQRFQDVELIMTKERGVVILQARPMKIVNNFL